MQAPVHACIIIIGNEILSGRTQDKNIAWLAKELNNIGVRLMEVRVIPDVGETIIATVNECSAKFAYVFTTGGIGPTHDDITSENIAKAFGVALERNPKAETILQKHYGAEKLNAARLRMADIPAGASLILNPISAAPGFRIGNVFVMAGVPEIMRAMFDNIRHELKGGAPMLSKIISAYITEGNIAKPLADIQARYPEVEIGSYPFVRQRLGTTLVVRGVNETVLTKVRSEIKEMLLTFTDEIFEEDLAN